MTFTPPPLPSDLFRSFSTSRPYCEQLLLTLPPSLPPFPSLFSLGVNVACSGAGNVEKTLALTATLILEKAR